MSKWSKKMKEQGRCIKCGCIRHLSKIYCNEHMIDMREKRREKRSSIKRYMKAKSYQIN